MKNVTYGFILAVSVVLSLYIGFTAGKNSAPSTESANDLVATYIWEGKPTRIELKDLSPFIQVDQSDYKKMIYRTRKQAIESLVAQKIRSTLDLEKIDIEPVSEQEFNEMVQKLKLDPRKLTEQQRRDILGNLSIGKRNQEINRKIQTASESLQLKIKLAPPFEFVSRPGEKGIALHRPHGNKVKSKITWYGNFHCPHCITTFEKIKFVITKYPENFEVDFIYHGQDPDNSGAFLTAKGLHCLKEFGTKEKQNQSTFDLINRLFEKVPKDAAEVSALLGNGNPDLEKRLSDCLADRSKNQKIRDLADVARQIPGAQQHASFLIFGDYFVPGAELMDLFQEVVSVSVDP